MDNAKLVEFATNGKKVASKSVIIALKYILNEYLAVSNCDNKAELEAKIAEIKPEYPTASALTMQFAGANVAETAGLMLCISLVCCESNYKCQIDVPNANYASELYNYYDFIKQIAIVYLKTYLDDHPEVAELCNKILGFKPSLVVDPASPTTMYMLASARHRVGIFCYYMDGQGQVYTKKN